MANLKGFEDRFNNNGSFPASLADFTTEQLQQAAHQGIFCFAVGLDVISNRNSPDESKLTFVKSGCSLHFTTFKAAVAALESIEGQSGIVVAHSVGYSLEDLIDVEYLQPAYDNSMRRIYGEAYGWHEFTKGMRLNLDCCHRIYERDGKRVSIQPHNLETVLKIVS